MPNLIVMGEKLAGWEVELYVGFLNENPHPDIRKPLFIEPDF